MVKVCHEGFRWKVLLLANFIPNLFPLNNPDRQYTYWVCMYLSLAVQNSKCFGFGHYRVLQKPLHTKKYLWFEPSCMMLQYKCGFVYISVRYVTYIANFFLKVLVKFWESKVLGFYFFTSIVSNMYIIYILCYTTYIPTILAYLHISNPLCILVQNILPLL